MAKMYPEIANHMITGSYASSFTAFLLFFSTDGSIVPPSNLKFLGRFIIAWWSVIGKRIPSFKAVHPHHIHIFLPDNQEIHWLGKQLQVID